MTRTELIEGLHCNALWRSLDTSDLLKQAADMLEADELIRLANIDCVNHFDAIKEDYDKLREAARLALEQMNQHWHYEMKDALDALKEAL